MRMPAFDHLTDVVVVGSGAAALMTALVAKEAGAEPLIIESTDKLGGNSALSGGGLWIPDNHVMRRAGQRDSYQEARTYLDGCVGDVGPASSPERRHAFLTQGPMMVQWLEDLGFTWVFGKGYADYYPERPGGKPLGRGIEGKKYDIKRLGSWADKLRYSNRVLPLYTTEVSKMALSVRTLRGFLTAARVVGIEAVLPRIVGKHLVGAGNSLMGRLLELVLARAIPIWLESPVTDLIVDDGRVAGAVVRHEGREMNVGARKGIMIAAGGFERNAAMREEYQEAPITDKWTSGSPGNTGGPLRAGIKAGAATALMEDAWWGPSLLWPGDVAGFMLWERSLPFCFIVDKAGRRFMNESESYVDAGHRQYERNRTTEAIPAWQIMDSRHRKYYPFGMTLPGKRGTRKLLEMGMLVEAQSLEDLARKIDIDPQGLAETARTFNEYARTGKDLDYHRGGSAYDRVYSDPRVKPNPNLGPVERPPFYAVKVYPGDLGTKGGILTDEFARALDDKGQVIEGLYAAGNSSASVMGHTYPGPGSTLGPATTFGYIGGRHMVRG
jgi:3-oxosteroid 1-dehydrogenase